MGSCLVSGTWFLIVKVQRDSGFLALHYGFQSPGSRNSAIKISRIKKIQITLNDSNPYPFGLQVHTQYS